MMVGVKTPKACARPGVFYEDYPISLEIIGRDAYFAIRDGTTDPAHVRALSNRIREIGGLDEVLLWQGPRGIVVLDGTHRIEAYRAVNWTQPVPARIVHCDRSTALLLAIQANSKVALAMSELLPVRWTRG